MNKVKAEHFSESYRHITVAGKVEINLKRIAKDCKPGIDRTERGNAVRTNLGIDRADSVCKNNLFSESPYEKQRACGKFADIVLAVRKILFNIVILNDGTCNKLRKH